VGELCTNVIDGQFLPIRYECLFFQTNSWKQYSEQYYTNKTTHIETCRLVSFRFLPDTESFFFMTDHLIRDFSPRFQNQRHFFSEHDTGRVPLYANYTVDFYGQN
jgi:hypothetical protein